MVQAPTRPFRLGVDPSAIGLVVRAVDVTPEIATYWLENRRSNRGLKHKSIAKLKRAMEADQFILNGETVVFATDQHDSLIDGQNRLEAVVQSGATVPMLVVFGVGDVMTTLDTGTARSITDVLRVRGEVDAPHLASATNYLWRHLQRRDASIETPNATEAERLIDHRRYRDLRYSVEKVAALCRPRTGLGVPWGMAAFCHFAFTSADADRGQQFFDQLGTGANLGEHDPILVLRQVLVGLRTSGAKTWRQHQKKDTLLYLVLAWNAWFDGLQVERLRWKPTVDDDFPRIRGDVLVK